METLSELT